MAANDEWAAITNTKAPSPVGRFRRRRVAKLLEFVRNYRKSRHQSMTLSRIIGARHSYYIGWGERTQCRQTDRQTPGESILLDFHCFYMRGCIMKYTSCSGTDPYPLWTASPTRHPRRVGGNAQVARWHVINWLEIKGLNEKRLVNR